jgi:hypothetical protein
MHKGKKPTTSPGSHASGNGKNGTVPPAEVAAAEARQKCLRVTFADGFTSDIRYSKVGVDPSAVDVGTLTLLPGGAGVVFQDKDSEPFPIDGATLRYLADAEYAHGVDQRIDASRIPADRLDRLIEKSEPPTEWFDSPQSKLF